jgi:hypothetical protein
MHAAVAEQLTNREWSTSSVCTSSSIGLDKLGITNPSIVNRNLSYEDLMLHEKLNEEGKFTNNGTFAVDTGKFTIICGLPFFIQLFMKHQVLIGQIAIDFRRISDS